MKKEIPINNSCRCASVILALALLCSSAALFASADDSGKDSQSASSPAEQHQTLVEDYTTAVQEFDQASRDAKTDEERQNVLKNHPKQKYKGRFLDLAEKHPDDPAAVDALVWVASKGTPGPASPAPEFEKALQILREKHLESEKLGPVCNVVGYEEYSATGAAEKFLTAVAAKNPHRSVRGQALFSLATHLKNQSSLVHSLKQLSARDLEEEEKDLGKDNVARLREMNLQKLLEQVEKRFEEVAEKYADLPDGKGTFGDGAQAALFELRNLAEGKVAPEIEGEDVDEKKFKLSDYRGKVVVIDFWGDW